MFNEFEATRDVHIRLRSCVFDLHQAVAVIAVQAPAGSMCLSHNMDILRHQACTADLDGHQHSLCFFP